MRYSSEKLEELQGNFICLFNIYWVVTKLPGSGNKGWWGESWRGLTFHHKVKRWKTKAKVGEERGKLSGAGWRGKITEQKWEKKELYATLWLSSWAKNASSLVSRGFPHGRSISVRHFWARVNDFLIAFCPPPNILWWGDEKIFKHRKVQRMGTFLDFLQSTVNMSLY